jgi:hypothetical protein
MNANQRSVVATATGLVAAVLFAAFFLHPFWQWATWNKKEGTLDLGFVKFTSRPPFPNDARGLGLGVVLPIALVAAARVLVLSGRGPGEKA